MKIERILSYSGRVVTEINLLLPQLSNNLRVFTPDDLLSIVNNKNVYLLVIRKVDRIVATLTLVTINLLSGSKGLIEDVIVEQDERGKGLAKALINEAIAISQQLGIQKIELSSKPSRISANILYQKMGFEKRETNSYVKNIMYKE